MPNQPAKPESGSFVVSAPRATDAIGQALRRAFGGRASSGLPADMVYVLREIDRRA